ncbi:MAG: single-stranded-DNA-specific exonuclease RecJ [Candidatus Shapirobacteria bacterium]|nr:single-stranded-DNA-specific exonuclease RecJ [Candidatus Shapirobacteria bacterium]
MVPKIKIKSATIVDNQTNPIEFLELLLNNRQIKNKDVDIFLNPVHPKELKNQDFSVSTSNLDKAVKRIKDAVLKNENILIYGDYDADGITATAILWQSLTKIGAKVLPFVPDREKDGYGIKAKSVYNFQSEKKTDFNLIITVDNGIVAHSEIDKLNRKNIDVIITDHHLPLTEPPNAIAIVHSTKISGSAISWLLASKFDDNADIGLAALGTVTDCMPLVDINRNLVVHGLLNLRLNPNPGLKKLMEINSLKQDLLSAFDLGFVLGPRINAVGRMSNPTDALRLLCSSNAIQASKYAQISNEHNQNRQLLQQNGIDTAQKLVLDNKDKLIFVKDESFQPGIIGLIAGRLTEKYYLPSIVIGVTPEISKGSCRSIKELNIIDALRQCSNLLVDVGGHSEAAGFSIETKKISKFKKTITQIINEKLKTLKLQPILNVDAEMKLSAVNTKNYKVIKKLEPFGFDNQEPIFIFKNLSVIQKRLIGANSDHLKLKLGDSYGRTQPTEAIAFKKGDLDSQIKIGSQVNIVARLDINVWNGVKTPQLIIKEILFDNLSN